MILIHASKDKMQSIQNSLPHRIAIGKNNCFQNYKNSFEMYDELNTTNCSKRSRISFGYDSPFKKR